MSTQVGKTTTHHHKSEHRALLLDVVDRVSVVGLVMVVSLYLQRLRSRPFIYTCILTLPLRTCTFQCNFRALYVDFSATVITCLTLYLSLFPLQQMKKSKQKTKVFFLGDLNYRIDLDREDVERALYPCNSKDGRWLNSHQVCVCTVVFRTHFT